MKKFALAVAANLALYSLAFAGVVPSDTAGTTMIFATVGTLFS